MGLIGGISPGGSIALGIIVGLLSTSVQSLGLTLQRKSHILEDEKIPYDVRRPPYRRRRWQLGMAMFVISNVVGSSVQISMLPLPVLSTLQASGLVFNSICATLILGEPFTRWSLWGTLLVCSGAVLIAVFGAIPSPAHKLSELLDLLGRRPFVIWMSFQAVFVIGLAAATELVSQLTTLMQDPRFRLARGFSYGCISGTLSAHSLLVAKSAVELIVRTITDGDNQFVHWQSWMLVLSLVTLALTQLYYLHRGLKLVSTSVLYPLIFCIYNIMAILDGLIYFRQTDLINPLRACLIALGTVILLSGVLALSWRLSDEQHAPSIGQSTLAPGLGLVDDTDGEEEEEEVSLRSGLLNGGETD
ncbi:9f85a715-a99e-45a2-8047-3c2458304f7a [Thermothielavioides terrestris]|uniref:9f85a715-a99e-45a2-8047-3c2458304f7a n=1 Tax=Thermothielavioides terrestris TaxID=2587410 RepID=A0A446BAS4_9PEZI|nr:9f85a715-a99e-45a2-8047-3c2458304f7a [Thermothielavioides terrestris]